jgi:hypothetical protein
MVCNPSIGNVVQLGIGMRVRIVQVWELDSKGKMQSVFSVQLNVSVPKAVAFTNNQVNDIYVLGLYDGNM